MPDMSRKIATTPSSCGNICTSRSASRRPGRRQRRSEKPPFPSRAGGGALSASARYGFIDATYQTGFSENSPVNTSADETGAIQVTGQGLFLPVRASGEASIAYRPR